MPLFDIKKLLLIGAVSAAAIGNAAAQPRPATRTFPEARSPAQTNERRAAQLPMAIVRRNHIAALTAADDIAIHELINRVYLAEDSLDAEALKDAVTADFILEDSITGRSTGRDAFAALVLGGADFRAGNRHTVLNLAVSPNGHDDAMAVHYLMALRVFGAETEARDLPRVLAFAIVRDRLVKEHGIWRIAHRVSDQVSILPSIVGDAHLREQGARVIVPGS
jgi:hypothetical protein